MADTPAMYVHGTERELLEQIATEVKGASSVTKEKRFAKFVQKVDTFTHGPGIVLVIFHDRREEGPPDFFQDLVQRCANPSKIVLFELTHRFCERDFPQDVAAVVSFEERMFIWIAGECVAKVCKSKGIPILDYCNEIDCSICGLQIDHVCKDGYSKTGLLPRSTLNTVWMKHIYVPFDCPWILCPKNTKCPGVMLKAYSMTAGLNVDGARTTHHFACPDDRHICASCADTAVRMGASLKRYEQRQCLTCYKIMDKYYSTGYHLLKNTECADKWLNAMYDTSTWLSCGGPFPCQSDCRKAADVLPSNINRTCVFCNNSSPEEFVVCEGVSYDDPDGPNGCSNVCANICAKYGHDFAQPCPVGSTMCKSCVMNLRRLQWTPFEYRFKCSHCIELRTARTLSMMEYLEKCIDEAEMAQPMEVERAGSSGSQDDSYDSDESVPSPLAEYRQDLDTLVAGFKWRRW